MFILQWSGKGKNVIYKGVYHVIFGSVPAHLPLLDDGNGGGDDEC